MPNKIPELEELSEYSGYQYSHLEKLYYEFLEDGLSHEEVIELLTQYSNLQKKPV